MPLPHVVVVGAGFGGLRAARGLRDAPVRVTLVDRHNYHLFQPLLYQVATAGLASDDITRPVRAIFRRQRNLSFLMAEVTGVDLASRTVATTRGTLDYDHLVLALGGETNFFGNAGVQAHGFALKDIADAVRMRNHVLSRFEAAGSEPDPARRRALLTFVVVGGGPTGVELAGAFAELMRFTLAEEHRGIRREEIAIHLLEAADRLLLALPPDLSAAAARALEDKGVRLRFGVKVTGYDGETVSLEGRDPIRASTLVWAAGIHASSLYRRLGLPLARQGRVAVEPTLQVPGHPEVYVVGDGMHLEQDGEVLPMVAQVAMQGGERAATNIALVVNGETPQPFRYTDLGTMATIGRNAAVAVVFGVKLSGFLGWWAWLALHVVQLIGFRNRVVVLVNWAWNYLFYDPGVRMIGPE